jgi:hypothetical protein
MAVWYSLWSFCIFFPFWYVWTEKNLATLHLTRHSSLAQSFFFVELQLQQRVHLFRALGHEVGRVAVAGVAHCLEQLMVGCGNHLKNGQKTQ